MTSLRHPPDSLSQTLQPIVEIIHRRIAVHLNVIYCIIKRNGVTVNDTQLGNQGFRAYRNKHYSESFWITL